jgi:undecaprenyl-diphosphatase
VIETLSSIDQKLFLVMNSWNATWLNPLMAFFSSQIIWIPFIVLILYVAFKQLEKKSFYIFLLFIILAIIASDVTSSYLLKNIFQRLRPCRVAEIKAVMNNFKQKCGGRFGFVSSHAANSFSILVFSFLVLEFKSLKIHFLWLIPLIVGFSRIYLGVHYPGDVLGGIVVGVTWGAALAMIFKNRIQTSSSSWSKPA